MNFIKSLVGRGDYYPLFKTLAFKLDPESVHCMAFQMLRNNVLSWPSLVESLVDPASDKYSVSLGEGLKWNFPIGLAAGLDKNAEALRFWDAIGFGAVEVGTITPRAQIGNPRPRLFRLEEDQSLRNSMGFNNVGGDHALRLIQKGGKLKNTSLGINIGKNKTTENKDAVSDYIELIKLFKESGQYLVINISSPNTAGLRDLQNQMFLEELLIEAQKLGKLPPLFIKISPDLNFQQLEELLKFCLDYPSIRGLIATNTTADHSLGAGGVSGKLLYSKARDVRNFLLKETRKLKNFHIIGVGGISQFEHLLDFWKNGGKCAQIYTSFIYQGPKILWDFKKQIDLLLAKHNLSNLEQLLKVIGE